MKLSRFLLAAALTALPALALAKSFLIDVRTPQEYADGHLKGAINLDHASIAQRIAQAGVGKDDEVILYCRSGRRSALAQEDLRRLGYTRVKDYGGIDEARRRLGQATAQ